ncbi:MAG: hypothetical protein ABJA79_01490 [Parafilimonas sp.]
MNHEKYNFLKNDFPVLLQQLQPDAKGKWGVMNAQQMVEHFSDAVRMASGKLDLPVVNTGERLEKSYQFMMSDIPFKENTKNPLLSETPFPVKHATMQQAISELELEIDDFFKTYENDNERRITNPFFGNLNFEDQVHLLHKHAAHHLKQFGIETSKQ